MMRIVSILFITRLLLLATVSLRSGAQSVTFVQITDAHIFDSGAHKTPLGGYEATLENGSSLAWAVLQVNRLAGSGRHLDFVAFTGDFGLEETDCGQIPQTKPSQNRPIRCSDAVDTAAIFLRALLVQKVLLVPGNNDVPGEDPRSITVYNSFVQRLKAKLSALKSSPSDPFPPVVVELANQAEIFNGIQIVGLDSSTFKNTGNGKIANFSEQQRILDGLSSRIQKGQPIIIITHIPDLEDPFRDNGVKRAWNLDPRLARKWDDIIKRPEVVAVFGGHFHDPRRIVYMHDYSWASQPPGRVEGDKTWVAPPLAIKFQENAKPQARGLLVATVTSTGAVTVQPKWFGFAEDEGAPDKGSLLLQAQAEASHGYWTRAASFYNQALASTDPNVRAGAEQGYLHAREMIHIDHWRKRIALFVAGVITVLAVAGIVGIVARRNRRRNKLVLQPLVKLTSDAPVDLFVAAISEAAREIEAVYQGESRRQKNPFSATDYDMPVELQLLSGGEEIISSIANSLPTVRGVNVGSVLRALYKLKLYFCDWRLELGLAIHADGASAYGVVRGWNKPVAWVESVKNTSTDTSTESSQAVVIRALAWRMASDILSRNLVIE